MAVLQYDDIVKKIKSGSFARMYYFYGRDVMSVENITKLLISKITCNGDDSSYQKFIGKDISLSELADYSEMFPMSADYNLIVINDLNAEEMSADDIKHLIEILDYLPQTSVVMFYITGFDVKDGKKYPTAKNKKIIDFIAKNGDVCEMELKTVPELVKSVVKSAERAGCSITPNNAASVVQLCLCNSMMIRNELDKLCSYADGSEITADMISALVPRQPDSTVFNLAKAVTSFNTKYALTLLDEMFIQQNNPISVLSAVSNAFIDFYRAKTALSCGKSEADVINDFSYKGREFVVRNAFRDCRRVSDSHLRKCLNVLRDTDRMLKSFSGDERIIIEQAIIKMTVR